MEATKKTFLAGLGIGVIIGYSIGVITTVNIISDYLKGRIIPKTETIQEEYIAPNMLEVECNKPLDKPVRRPTIKRVDGLLYILKEVNNKQVLIPYII